MGRAPSCVEELAARREYERCKKAKWRLKQMARVVDELPKWINSKYPWDEWLDGQVWLIEDKEFTVGRESFRNAVYTAAEARGLKAAIRLRPEGVYVQAG